MYVKSLVTGGLGFIGSHVVEALISEGHEVLGVDDLSTGSKQNAIPGADYSEISILDPKLKELASEFSPDYIFHLAALPRIQPSFEEPLLHNKVNVDGTIYMLEIARDTNVSAFVNSSSASIYGNPRNFPITEDTPVDPLSPYALQKYSAERYVKILGEKWQIPNVSLRYFNPFGTRSFNQESDGNAYSPVLGVFEHSVKETGKIFITGDGLQSRDFIYVGDVARANVVAAKNIKKLSGGVFNISSGQHESILSIAKKFNSPIEFIHERPGEAKISWGSNERFVKATDWKPSISISQYITKML
jgi:UDP-glucose 4-epimerase